MRVRDVDVSRPQAVNESNGEGPTGGGVDVQSATWRRLGYAAGAFVLWAAFAALPGGADASSPAGAPTVRPAGAVWQFPEAVTGVGYGGPRRLWVFLSPRAILPPDQLWEVDPVRRRVLLRVSLPAPRAVGTSPDGAAFVAEGAYLDEWWRGRRARYPLPVGTQVVALAARSHDAVWLALRLGTAGRVEVALERLPQDVPTYAHRLAGMANETVQAMAAAPGGVWVATQPRPVLYWAPATGGGSTYTKLYAKAFFPAQAQGLAGIAVNARGRGWLSGATTDGQRAVWPIRVQSVGTPIALPSVVNMVSDALAVSPGGVGFVGFSAVGGTSGYPGVVAVSPQGKVRAPVWPDLAVPGGGVGALLLTSTGQLWCTVPFSHLLVPLAASP